MAVDRLDIQVSEKGSREAATNFSAMADSVARAGKNFAAFRRALKDIQLKQLNKSLGAFSSLMNQVSKKSDVASAGVDKFDHKLHELGAELDSIRGKMHASNQAMSASGAAFGSVRTSSAATAAGLNSYSKASAVAANSGLALSKNVFNLKNAFATLGVVAVVGQYTRLSDSYSNLTNRLRQVTKSEGELADTRSRLFSIANKSRQSVGATAESYVRLRRATADMGVTNKQVAGVQETINNLLLISGQTAGESASSMLQLSQAFSKGKLDGDEFRSVAENMPDILLAVQKSLGVTKGELYALSKGGKLTTDVLIKALDGYSDTAKEAAKNTDKTIGQSLQVLGNKATEAVGKFNEFTGASKLFAGAIGLIANHLDLLLPIIIAVGAAITYQLLGPLIGGLMTSAIKSVGTLTQKIVLMQAASSAGAITMAGAFGAIGAGVAVAAVFMSVFGDRIEEATDKLADLATGYDGTFETTAESQLDQLSESIEKAERLVQTEKIRLKNISNMTREQKLWNNYKKNEVEAQEKILRYTKDIAVWEGVLKSLQKEESAKKEEEQRIQALSVAYQALVTDVNKVTSAKKQYIENVRLVNSAYTDLNTTLVSYLSMQAALLMQEGARQVKGTKFIEDRIHALERENKLSGIKNKKLKAQAIATYLVADAQARLNEAGVEIDPSRLETLFKLEEKAAFALLQNAKSKKNQKSAEEELNELRARLIPQYAAQIAVEKDAGIISKATNATLEEKADLLKKSRDAVLSNLDPITAYAREVAKESEILKFNTERQREFAAARQTIVDIMGRGLTNEETLKLIDADNVAALNDFQRQSNEGKKQASAILDEILGKEDLVTRAKKAQLQLEIASGKYSSDQVKKLQEAIDGKKTTKKKVGITDETQSLLGASELTLEYARRQEALDKQFADGAIVQSQYTKANEELNRQRERAIYLTTYEGAAMASLSEQFFSQDALVKQYASAVTSAYSAIENAIADMVVQLANGEGSWQSFGDIVRSVANQILADSTKILIRQGIAAAAGGSFPGLKHGGTIRTNTDIPRFAHGGSMQVGGHGGPDTKLVQFMASPGENIHVTNPGQSRLDNRQQAPVQAPQVNIQNYVDPSQFSAALNSPAGTRAIVNAVQMNPELFRRLTQ